MWRVKYDIGFSFIIFYKFFANVYIVDERNSIIIHRVESVVKILKRA